MKIIPYDKLLSEKGIAISKRQAKRLSADGRFPRLIHVSEKITGFLESEIDALIAERAAERDQVETGSKKN